MECDPCKIVSPFWLPYATKTASQLLHGNHNQMLRVVIKAVPNNLDRALI